MNTTIRTNRTAKRALAFLLCLFTVFSVLAFADGAVFQTFAANDLDIVQVSPTYTPKFDKKTYKALLEELNAQLSTTKFPKMAKKFFRDLLKLEVQNYPQWRIVYRDLPAAKTYIRENLINVIPMIGKIKLVNVDTPEGKVYLERSGFEGRTTISGDKSNVTVLYRNPAKIKNYEHEKQLEVFAHELRHVRDRVCCKDTKFPTKTLRQIIVDGAASFHERFVLPIATYNNNLQEFIASRDCGIVFKCERNVVYPYFQTFYDVLVYLAGYHIVDAVGKGKDPLALKRAVAKRYDSQTAEKLWALLQKLPMMEKDNNFVDSAKAFRAVNDIFCLFLSRIKGDIKKLNKNQPETVRKFMDVYRNIKMKVVPDVLRVSGDSIEDVTGEYFLTNVTDECLINKIIASKALPTLFPNKEDNRRAIGEILCAEIIGYETSYDYLAFLPPTIAQTEYTFFMQSGKPRIVETFKDEADFGVIFVCVLNNDGSVSRDADYYD